MVGEVVGVAMPCLVLIPPIGHVVKPSPPRGSTNSLPSVGMLRTIAGSSSMPAPDPGRKNASRMYVAWQRLGFPGQWLRCRAVPLTQAGLRPCKEVLLLRPPPRAQDSAHRRGGR